MHEARLSPVRVSEHYIVGGLVAPRSHAPRGPGPLDRALIANRNSPKNTTVAAMAKATAGLYACHTYPPPTPARSAPNPTAALSHPNPPPRSRSSVIWAAKER